MKLNKRDVDLSWFDQFKKLEHMFSRKSHMLFKILFKTIFIGKYKDLGIDVEYDVYSDLDSWEFIYNNDSFVGKISKFKKDDN